MRSEVFPFADEVKSSTFAEQTWLLYLSRKRSHRTIKKKKKAKETDCSFMEKLPELSKLSFNAY